MTGADLFLSSFRSPPALARCRQTIDLLSSLLLMLTECGPVVLDDRGDSGQREENERVLDLVAALEELLRASEVMDWRNILPNFIFSWFDTTTSFLTFNFFENLVEVTKDRRNKNKF
eukprot:scaffold381_cov178-Amphora_coffeaeformis.AAC.7